MATTNLNVHFNAPSVRFDTWAQLSNCATQLSGLKDGTPEFDKVHAETDTLVNTLRPMEAYMGFPGKAAFERIFSLFQASDYVGFESSVQESSGLLESGEYRRTEVEKAFGHSAPDVHYFEVLVVCNTSAEEQDRIRQELWQWRSNHDSFAYNVVTVGSFEDAMMAIMLNFNIQACVIYDEISLDSHQSLHALEGLKKSLSTKIAASPERPNSVLLGDFIHQLRPEINLFLCTKISPEKLAGDVKSFFQRIFHRHEAASELHLSIVKAVADRYETPFFDAVKRYSRQPVGTFHALPIARGNSVFHSPWMRDFYEFYGADIFLAESSATTGGMDSILQPTGTLKRAQEKTSECYGSQRSFYVTNGTSTANKIVHQTVTRPGDIVMLDRACHESHHFAFLLTGASPHYLNSYQLDKYSIAGSVQLVTIKKQMLDLKKKGLLDRVKMIILTNCTFDGLTYNVQRYMDEILAIKPDIVFLWDEAWFGFARFVPHYRQRTGMHSASVLSTKYNSDEYRKEYEEYKKSFLSKHPEPDDAWIDQQLMPDPDVAIVRAYATQSTHKTLSCFRQGSMIHVHDDQFNERAKDQFTKAYFTHTTTSPNYQIIASLDVSRRQMHLEGYELVQRQIEMAILIRKAINTHPLLKKYFNAMGPAELIPEHYRISGVKSSKEGFKAEKEWEAVARAWEMDDFVLDPCRINVYTAKTGISGFTLRTAYLADKYSIQVNKTGLNTFCLMTNVGTTRSSVAYLINCLILIAEECDQRDRHFSDAQREKFQEKRETVTKLPPLPPIPPYHPNYLLDADGIAGKMREAYFDGYDSDVVNYYSIDELGELVNAGKEVVGASFVVPVPPGYPMIAPGQCVTKETITFLQALNPGEILGLDPELGVRTFKEDFIKNGASPIDSITKAPSGTPKAKKKKASAS